MKQIQFKRVQIRDADLHQTVTTQQERQEIAERLQKAIDKYVVATGQSRGNVEHALSCLRSYHTATSLIAEDD